MTHLFLCSNQRKEHVERNLDGIEEEKTVLGGDVLETNGVYYGPDLPGPLYGRKEVGLDLVSNHGEAVTVDESEVGEKDRHENRAPKDLVECNLGGNLDGVRSWDEVVEPVVEEVSARSVVEESKGGERSEALEVEWSSTDKKL